MTLLLLVSAAFLYALGLNDLGGAALGVALAWAVASSGDDGEPSSNSRSPPTA